MHSCDTCQGGMWRVNYRPGRVGILDKTSKMNPAWDAVVVGRWLQLVLAIGPIKRIRYFGKAKVVPVATRETHHVPTRAQYTD